MKLVFMTRVLKISETRPQAAKIRVAARAIRSGGLVVFPTETVYGIGCDAYNKKATAEIYRVKGRPPDNPLMIHVSDMEMARRVGRFPRRYEDAIGKLWPGPVAFVVDAQKGLGRKEVSMRMPDHKVALALIRASNTPIAAPSANISKKPSSTNAGHALMYFDGKVDVIIDSGSSMKGIESTILDLRTFVLQRPGALPVNELERAFGRRIRIGRASRGLAESKRAIAPGMKYRHYAPATPLFLYTGKAEKLPRMVSGLKGIFAFIGSYESCRRMRKDAIVLGLGSRRDYDAIAHNLFDRLIELDRTGADFAIAESYGEEGLGLGIMNRLRKASNHRQFSGRRELDALLAGI